MIVTSCYNTSTTTPWADDFDDTTGTIDCHGRKGFINGFTIISARVSDLLDGLLIELSKSPEHVLPKCNDYFYVKPFHYVNQYWLQPAKKYFFTRKRSYFRMKQKRKRHMQKLREIKV